MRDVDAGRLLADVELAGDLPVGAAEAEEGQHLDLAGRDPEVGERIGLRWLRFGAFGQVEPATLGQEADLFDQGGGSQPFSRDQRGASRIGRAVTGSTAAQHGIGLPEASDRGRVGEPQEVPSSGDGRPLVGIGTSTGAGVLGLEHGQMGGALGRQPDATVEEAFDPLPGPAQVLVRQAAGVVGIGCPPGAPQP
jgi:hypothetical protein